MKKRASSPVKGRRVKEPSASWLAEVPHPTLEIQPAAQKHELGQFFTPEPVAHLMASMFTVRRKDIRLLDAGAGVGSLTKAFVETHCSERTAPRSIHVVVYELDTSLIAALQGTMTHCRAVCERAGVNFSYDIRNVDFLESVLPELRDDLFARPTALFNSAILNPPYRKISSQSRARLLLRSAGIETSNLYTGFLALAAKLLCDGGEMVAITPRSFANGPYFKPFRQFFLGCMSLRRLHVFESRSTAFAKDNVLQENIILNAVKSGTRPGSVIISSSTGTPDDPVRERPCAYSDMVSPEDPEQFIHMPTNDQQQGVREVLSKLHTSLKELGLEVSTGRVVDFRARRFLLPKPGRNTMPLIYPCNFSAGYVAWPKLPNRKPAAILDAEETQELLVPSETYVLAKRFTSKEERRRVVACVYDPKRIPAARVGFENHLNYFHARGRGLPMDLACGLAAFLNSTLLDVYFRQFNGHTQVNATDLRNLSYPSRKELESLGRQIGAQFPSQEQLDQLIQQELFDDR